jgi:CheY-like chemotaxis protein
MRSFLRYHGLAVIPVSDARDALMLAPQADIVVTGITLDDLMDGVELVSRLRYDDCTRSTPIVVLTACAWSTDRDVFLPKPCLPNDLLGEVLTATRSQTADTAHVCTLPVTVRTDTMSTTGSKQNENYCREVARATEPVLRQEREN